MSWVEASYLGHLERLYYRGEHRKNRTGIDTFSIFGHHMSIDLADGFPLLTTKKVHFKSIAHELLWFISGDTNIKYLQDNGVTIWDEWADKDGNLGAVYGHQWRNWTEGHDYHSESFDQLQTAIDMLKTDPNSRRNIVSAWHVADLPSMALPPCHLLFQFMTSENPNGLPFLHCQVYQRSADWFLGVPFNIASYALLVHLVAKLVDMTPGKLHMCFGDTHLYANQLTAAKQQMERRAFELPTLEIIERGQKTIDDFKFEDLVLTDYQHHEAIKASVVV